jgi:hypothetical protein
MSKTILTLTLPDAPAENAVIVAQRGELARVHPFTYTRIADLTEVIAEALVGLTEVEVAPPVISKPESAKPKQSAKKPTKPTSPNEPTIDVPLKKGMRAVKASHIQIVGGESDAAAYRQAVVLAGRLIDGKLWDGESLIRFDHVYRVAHKMKYLTDRDFSLFTLADFVQLGKNTAEVI